MSQRVLSSAQFADETLSKGGVSVRVASGFRPRSGWMVSRHGYEEAVPEAEFNAARLGRYRRKHARPLREPGVYLGTWHDKGKHEVDLDQSERHLDFSIAQREAIQEHQRAIYDMKTGKTVHLTGPGALGQVAIHRGSRRRG